MTEALNTAEKLFHAPGRARPGDRRPPSSPPRSTAPMTASCSWNTANPKSISLDDGRIRAASFDTRRGFGLRAVLGEASYYAHAGELSDEALARAAATIKAARAQEHAVTAAGPAGRPTRRSMPG